MRLLVELINFLLLLGGLVWLYRRYRLGRFFDNYRARVTAEIQQAQQLEAEAERLGVQAEEELARAGERAREILEGAQRAGERLREEHRAAAQAEARRIMARARGEVELVRARVHEELRRETARELISQAEQLLARELGKEDHRRLTGAFLEGVTREAVEVRAG